MNWGRKIIRHVFPIIRLVTIFFVALFLPRFFLRTFKKGKKDQKQTHVQIVSHHHHDTERQDEEEEKKLLLKKLHTLS